VVSVIAPEPNIRWPPNRVMVPVSVAVSVSDDVDSVELCGHCCDQQRGGGRRGVTGPLEVQL
jgi:hypothetical protein